jgi:2-dehydro-3-deoxygluconokinase
VNAYDVITIGEALIEVSALEPLNHAVSANIGVSGDALNVAAAAAAAGARVALVGVVSDDELGSAVIARVRELGIADEFLIRRPVQQGVYFVHSDPTGDREFSYVRRNSAGSTLAAEHLPRDALANAGAVITSGITGALSKSSREAVIEAATVARRFVYDPNFRPRLTRAEEARSLLFDLAPYAWLMTPSGPAEISQLLETSDAVDAANRLRRLGVDSVVVTRGAAGSVYVGPDVELTVPAVPTSRVIDQTGAGDAFLGTLVARLVRGDSTKTACRLAASAASLAVGYAGGAGSVPSLAAVRAHAWTGV